MPSFVLLNQNTTNALAATIWNEKVIGTTELVLHCGLYHVAIYG